MSLVYIDFRQTLGFVTDPANAVACLADVYPTTRGGFTFGWVTTAATPFDGSAAGDARLAGINFRTNNAGAVTFQLDLAPLGGAGTYKIGIALGSATDAEPQQHAVIKDGATTLFSVDNAGGPSANQFVDASGGIIAGASWASSQTYQTVTIAGSSLTVTIGGSGDAFATCLACLYVQKIGSIVRPPRVLAGGFFN